MKNEEQNMMSVFSSILVEGISFTGGITLDRFGPRVCAGNGGVISSNPVDFTIRRWKQFEYGREHMISGYANIKKDRKSQNLM